MSRRTVRYVAAAIATTMSAIYLLIGFEVVHVVDDMPAGSSILDFGASAAGIFFVGAIFLVTLDRRSFWIAGMVLQVLVALMYVAVAPTRHPSFEVWGVTLRMLQIPLFAALAWLALTARAAQRRRVAF